MSFRHLFRRFHPLCWFLPVLLGAGELPAEILYETDFEAFSTAGFGTWAGTDGWTLGTSTSISSASVCHNISNIVSGYGKSAALGKYAPTFSTLLSSTNFVRVGRKITPDPVAAGKPIVEFYCVLGLAASTTGGKDDFELLVYNQSDKGLAGLTFDLADGYIYRTDGVGFTNTGLPVEYDTFMEVNMRVNYLTNRWSADVGGVQVVNGAVFTNRTDTPIDFGSMQARWFINSPYSPGNNWILVDDWTISAWAEELPKFTSITRSGTSTTLQWYGEVGYSYKVQAKLDLAGATWTTLTPVPLTTTSSRALLSYTDTSAATVKKFYRLARTLP
jgi:hypothetical protein